MEHRWGRRTETAIDVSILARPWATGRGCIRNLSMTGAFVQTGLALPLLAPLELELHLRLPGGLESYRIATTVVRTSDLGLGVEWCDSLSAEFVRLATGVRPESQPLAAARAVSVVSSPGVAQQEYPPEPRIASRPDDRAQAPGP